MTLILTETASSAAHTISIKNGSSSILKRKIVGQVIINSVACSNSDGDRIILFVTAPSTYIILIGGISLQNVIGKSSKIIKSV